MCTQEQKRERIAVVMELILLGHQRREICQSASKLGWTGDKGEPLTDRQVDRYIREVNDQLEAMAEVKREREFGKARLRYERLFSKSYQIQDYKACRQIQGDLCTLFRLTDDEPEDHGDVLRALVHGLDAAAKAVNVNTQTGDDAAGGEQPVEPADRGDPKR